MAEWKFEGDDKVLIPHGSHAITSSHRQVTYPSYEEIRRVVLSRREAKQKIQEASDELARLGVPIPLATNQ